MTATNHLTPSQAVAIAGRSYDHIHKAMKSGALKATQAYPHAPWQINPEDLDRWIAQGRPARRVAALVDADSRVAS